MSRSVSSSAADAATVRSVRDRVARAQRAYAGRLREGLEALRPLVEEGDTGAAAAALTIEAEIAHIKYGSAIVDD